jgi:hypothetical protein
MFRRAVECMSLAHVAEVLRQAERLVARIEWPWHR